MIKNQIKFPTYSGVRCLMMPYIQGDPTSVPPEYKGYSQVIRASFIEKGAIGYLTIDESPVLRNTPHRASRAKFKRALHTEAGVDPNRIYNWGGGGGGWGKRHNVELEPDLRILLANNLDSSCALWDTEHENTSLDGDIGHCADQYPMEDAVFMAAGEVHEIGILTPHESLPVKENTKRQFLRIIGAGVHGREPYFTKNPLTPTPASNEGSRDT